MVDLAANVCVQGGETEREKIANCFTEHNSVIMYVYLYFYTVQCNTD